MLHMKFLALGLSSCFLRPHVRKYVGGLLHLQLWCFCQLRPISCTVRTGMMSGVTAGRRSCLSARS